MSVAPSGPPASAQDDRGIVQAGRLTNRRSRSSVVQSVVGVLADGTPFYVPAGVVWADAETICCHLCGRWFRSVAAHLPSHGWTRQHYLDSFGLEQGQPLESTTTRTRRATALLNRLEREPAWQQGASDGRDRARNGQLAAAAAKANRGRRHPPQRQTKTLQALAGISPEAIASANRRRAADHLSRVADTVARRFGYPDLGSFVVARLAAGHSLASISLEAGLHKDWLSRHLPTVVELPSTLTRRARAAGAEADWAPVLARLGFLDAATYLRERHVEQDRTLHQISLELGCSRSRVQAALIRHGIPYTPHATSRSAAQSRATDIAARLGHATLASYISDRRSAGWAWTAIAAESGQPATWLRRHAVSEPPASRSGG